MDILHSAWFRIILSSAAIYLFIILAIRLFGKRELSQLSVFDLVFILLISNAVQNAMVLGDETLVGGLLAALTLFVVNYLFKKLQLKFPRLGRLVQGEPLMLVYRGKFIPSHLKTAGISEDEVNQAIREHGVASVEDVDLVILEVDGNLSVLSDDYKQQSHRHRRAHKIVGKQTD